MSTEKCINCGVRKDATTTNAVCGGQPPQLPGHQYAPTESGNPAERGTEAEFKKFCDLNPDAPPIPPAFKNICKWVWIAAWEKAFAAGRAAQREEDARLASQLVTLVSKAINAEGDWVICESDVVESVAAAIRKGQER